MNILVTHGRPVVLFLPTGVQSTVLLDWLCELHVHSAAEPCREG